MQLLRMVEQMEELTALEIQYRQPVFVFVDEVRG